ncbi:elongation factor 1-beta [Candidatus Bathyarchaeota archaeon]|nr:elongation factor 1-beta [Candidatus Bathyarchaeota archaeon]
MARVLASIKVFPSDPSADLTRLKAQIQKRLPGDVSVMFQEEPVAFGLVALIADLLMPEDADGKMDEVENTLRSTEGVSEIQVVSVRRA